MAVTTTFWLLVLLFATTEARRPKKVLPKGKKTSCAHNGSESNNILTSAISKSDMCHTFLGLLRTHVVI